MGRAWPAASVGILPVGALGAAFFFHLTRGLRANDGRVCFLERSGSVSAARLRAHGTLFMADGDTPRALAVEEVCRPDLLACGAAGALPEVLLVATQPDQLLPVVAEYVTLFEQLCRAHGLDAAVARLPLLVLCSNGIYHERVRRFLVELLEEAMLYGRLPDLWSAAMGRIVGKLLRGVTIQTGHRAGSGAEAVFHPGPPGRTTLAGGDPAHRQRCARLLSDLGGWFEAAESAPPVRVEFDKALINLWANLLGQSRAIDATGAFRLLTVREIFSEEESVGMRELAAHVFAVGRAVRAYREDEDFDQLYGAAVTLAAGMGGHIPSSLKWIEAHLAAGILRPQLGPTERWLLEPLTRYALTAGLAAAADYFTALRQRVEQQLAAALASPAIHRFYRGSPTLHYVERPAAGPPLLLLHGVGRCWRDWELLLPELARDWRVVALEHRGHGESGRAPGGYLVTDYARDAAEFVRATFSEPVTVIGHSLGAMVALSLAAECAALIARVVLEDPPFHTLRRDIGATPYRAQFAGMQQAARRGGSAAAVADALAKIRLPAAQGTVGFGDLHDRAALEFSAECLADVDPEIFTPLIAGCWLDGFEAAPLWPRVTCPVLLLQGDPAAGGAFCDADVSSARRALAAHQLVRFAGVGHQIHGTQPTEFLAAFRAFASTTSSSPPP